MKTFYFTVNFNGKEGVVTECGITKLGTCTASLVDPPRGLIMAPAV
jgi:hypothetical protein